MGLLIRGKTMPKHAWDFIDRFDSKPVTCKLDAKIRAVVIARDPMRKLQRHYGKLEVVRTERKTA